MRSPRVQTPDSTAIHEITVEKAASFRHASGPAVKYPIADFCAATV